MVWGVDHKQVLEVLEGGHMKVLGDHRKVLDVVEGHKSLKEVHTNQMAFEEAHTSLMVVVDHKRV